MAKRVLRSSIQVDDGIVLQGPLTQSAWDAFVKKKGSYINDYHILYIDKGASLSENVGVTKGYPRT